MYEECWLINLVNTVDIKPPISSIKGHIAQASRLFQRQNSRLLLFSLS